MTPPAGPITDLMTSDGLSILTGSATSSRTITPAHLAPYSSTSPLSRRSALPSSSRVDPATVQRQAPVGGILGWGGRNWLSFVWFLGAKGFDIAGDLVKYGLFGPPKPSWGIEMTLVCAFMRNLSQHSSLTDITLIRQLISVHYLLPLPPDAMVTPITFTVKKRKEPLRGFFCEMDGSEPGDRELSGEWVVGRNVWKRLKSERMRDATSSHTGGTSSDNDRRPSWSRSTTGAKSREASTSGHTTTTDLEGVGIGSGRTTSLSASVRASSMDVSERRRRKHRGEEKVIYYIHGGAYYLGTAATHRLITIAISKVCDARVFAINYRLSPEVRFPCALHDVIRGYMRLTDSLKISPDNIIVMGDSAGGSLAIALSMYLRDNGYRLPRALVVMSPWVDMTMSCGSWDENSKYDVIPMPDSDDHLNPIQCYMGPEGMKEYLTHPYASPLFGDFTGLPPMLVQFGDAEVLRDEVTLLAHKAALAGVEVKSELFVDAVHVFQAFPFLEAATAAFKSIGKFVTSLKDRPPSREVLSRTSVMEPANNDEVCRARSFSADGERTSPRGSIDSVSGIDTVGNEIAAGEPTYVRSDGTEVKGKEARDVDDVFVAQVETSPIREHQAATAGPTTTTPRPRSPTNVEAAAGGSPTPSGTSTPKPPLLRRAISSFSRSTGESRRRPSVSFFMPQSPPAFTQANPMDEAATAPSSAYNLPSPRSERQRHSHSRRGSVVARLTLSPAKPTTRLRSRSNVDMVDLVERYSREGPAHQTVVYTPRRESIDLPDEDDMDAVPVGVEGEEVHGLGLTQ